MLDQDFDDAIVPGRHHGSFEHQQTLFARLRQDDPVHWTEPVGYRPFWTVTRHADILEVAGQPERFLSAPRSRLCGIEFEQSLAGRMAGTPHLVRGLTQLDGPEHQAYRQLAHDWLQPSQLARVVPHLHALARRTVQEMHALGDAFDFHQVTNEFALRAVMLMLGLPHTDESHLRELAAAYIGSGDTESQSGHGRIRAARDYIGYFERISEARRRHPADDVASRIANALIDGRPIGHHEAASYYVTLVSAGHGTTSATAAGGLLALAQHPEQWRALQANPALVPTAVEEMVRWVSPVRYSLRTAACDSVLRGRGIRAGEALMLSYPSGNRDAAVFTDPMAFRVDRDPNRHLGFGHGAHACLGAFLARHALQGFYQELLFAVDAVELAGDPVWLASSRIGGLEQLPVRVRWRAGR